MARCWQSWRFFASLAAAQGSLILLLVPYGRVLEISVFRELPTLDVFPWASTLAITGTAILLVEALRRWYKLVGQKYSLLNILLFFAAASALILASSELPGTAAEFMHLPLYGLLAWSVAAIFLAQSSPLARASCNGFVIAVLWGVLDESLQGVHPERVFDPQDILLNALGACWGLLLLPLALTASPEGPISSEIPIEPLKQPLQ